MEEIKKKKVIFSVDEELHEKVERLKRHLHKSRLSDVYRDAVVFMYKKEFPGYRDNTPAKSPQQKAADQLEREEARSKLKENKARAKLEDLVARLEGRFVIDEKGHEYVEYMVHEEYGTGKVTSYPTREPTEIVNEDMLKYQYKSHGAEKHKMTPKEYINKLLAEQK